MRIDVEQRDIDAARWLHRTPGIDAADIVYWCPVAQATQRVLERDDVWVGAVMMHVDDKDVPLPLYVSSWIRRFDSGKEVAPFSFDLGWEEPQDMNLGETVGPAYEEPAPIVAPKFEPVPERETVPAKAPERETVPVR